MVSQGVAAGRFPDLHRRRRQGCASQDPRFSWLGCGARCRRPSRERRRIRFTSKKPRNEIPSSSRTMSTCGSSPCDGPQRGACIPASSGGRRRHYGTNDHRRLRQCIRTSGRKRMAPFRGARSSISSQPSDHSLMFLCRRARRSRGSLRRTSTADERRPQRRRDRESGWLRSLGILIVGSSCLM